MMKATSFLDVLVGNSISNFPSRELLPISDLFDRSLLLPDTASDVICRDDMFAQDSIELLKTSGIDFDRFEKYGIDVQYFGEVLMMSGLVLNDDIRWLSFHSKYDFGYLLKTLTCIDLPVDEQGFLEQLFTYFPCIYDVKVS